MVADPTGMQCVWSCGDNSIHLDGGGCLPLGSLLAAVLTPVLVLMWICHCYRQLREVDQTEIRVTMAALRTKLKLGPCEGFLLNSEWWRETFTRVIRGSLSVPPVLLDPDGLQAAARLWLLIERGFDRKALDSLWITVRDRSPQSERFGLWLVEVCTVLLRPEPSTADLAATTSQEQRGHACALLTNAGAAANAAADAAAADGDARSAKILRYVAYLRKVRGFFSFLAAKVSPAPEVVIDPESMEEGMAPVQICGEESLRTAGQTKRYEFFVGEITKLQIWREPDLYLFDDLKCNIQKMMNELASDCHHRYKDLLRMPGGDALPRLNLCMRKASTLACSAHIAHREPGLEAIPESPTREPRPQDVGSGWDDKDDKRSEESTAPTEDGIDYRNANALNDDISKEDLEEILLPLECGAIVTRQDDEQVCAIRIGIIDRLEEALQRIKHKQAAEEKAMYEDKAAITRRMLMPQPEPPVLMDEEVLNSPARLATPAVTLRDEQDRLFQLIASNGSPCWKDANASILPDNLIGNEKQSIPINSFQRVPSAKSSNSSSSAGRSSSKASEVLVECQFADGEFGDVHVHSAPVKDVGRMREKLAEYAPPHPRGTWPLTANIMDPVRAALVVPGGPARLSEVACWLAGPEARQLGLRVCRVKNGFALPEEAVQDGYRDVKVFVVFDLHAGNEDEKKMAIVGEIQVHDHALHQIKTRMHKLYRVKRAHAAYLI